MRRDLPWLACAIVAGGVAAPIVLMLSLRSTPAATASLLLNFEGVATGLIAAVIFREAIDRRIWAAIGCIMLGSALLTSDTGGGWGLSMGAVGVLAACVFWGVDNNATRNMSTKDPLTIVMVKGLVAGSVSMVIAAVIRSPFPAWDKALLAMLFGSISYGLSIVLFILAMRGLGAARTGAYFGTAPFIGALVSVAMFDTVLDVRFLLSLPLMIAGGFLLLSERHEHTHEHWSSDHEHRHLHTDEHHDHSHDDSLEQSQAHSHRHKHHRKRHSHPHTPDDHHRHRH